MGVNMNLKYYIRGIGVGILFTAVIMSVAFHSMPGKELTDAQIKERAKKLGMVESESADSLKDLLSTPTATPTPTDTPTPTETPTPEDKSKEGKGKDSKETEGAADTKKAEDSKDSNDLKDEGKDVPASTTKGTSAEDSIEVDITVGMTSEQVARLLKEKGIVEDSAAFNQYLVINNYTTDIKIGKFQLKTYAAYKDIADLIIEK
ncbi:hypothetical protein SAMN02745136_01260 [Anaerocolumna jejuensis DSM 15929]|uniref:YceG-like family protein n=2 Tax=Anaerocolumna TaxID=1843210 RepID=A0A1M6NCX0_9FIRM|nr:hypothetical protein SAMN02745136_01260 [Anaerocolumna jejuensis DSM 15929]